MSGPGGNDAALCVAADWGIAGYPSEGRRMDVPEKGGPSGRATDSG